MAAQFQHLFTPIKVGSMNVKNRIMIPTHSAGIMVGTEEQFQQFLAYYVGKAKGGAAWVGAGPNFIENPWGPGFVGAGVGAAHHGSTHHPDYVPRLKRYMQALHDCGAVGSIQLVIQGGMPGGASTTQTSLVDNEVPHEFEPEEIKFLLDDYRFAAERIREGGADAIEFHANHDDVIQWFMSPLSNKRTDEYGGSFEKRMRFLMDATNAVRAGAGNDIVVGIRLCPDEMIDGGYNLDDAKQIAQYFANSGKVDYIHVDMGSNWGAPSYIPPGTFPEGAWAYTAAAIKEAVNIPVIYTGRVTDPLLAERILADGHADLVGMARASRADADFPNKAREGRLDDIRRCIGVNSCIDRGMYERLSPGPQDKLSGCAVNPCAGREAEWDKLIPATTKKHVVVVGGGPGGLETARVATERGHRVTLLERDGQLGGLVNIAAKSPSQEILLDFVRWERYQMEKLKVDVRLNTEATADSVLALKPDAVVVATGTRPRRLGIPGDDQPNVVELRDVLQDKATVGERVLVISKEDHMQTLDVANFLAARGKKVEILYQTREATRLVGRYAQGGIFAQVQS
ncbi:MAG: FAD-dependent oxidoreductase, partial [Chloroflexi bacterium]|nr:FAD-dependent oxidoreductase [Chloroflexota bacterium]